MVIRTGTSSGRATPEARRFDADAEPKLGRCFPIFSRCDYKTRMMVIAEVNDENALRSSGAKTDPYAVFWKMLRYGQPPNDCDALRAASKAG
jgi:toxin YhaV